MKTKEEILKEIKDEELQHYEAYVAMNIRRVEDKIKKLLKVGNPIRLPIYFGDYQLPSEADPKQALLVPISMITKIKESLSSAKYVFEEGESLSGLSLLIVDLSQGS